MSMTMNLKEAHFTLADVIKGAMIIIPLVTFFSVMDSKMSMQIDNQQEMRKTQVDFVREYRIEQEAFKTRLNIMNIDLQLLKQRVDLLEGRKK